MLDVVGGDAHLRVVGGVLVGMDVMVVDVVVEVVVVGEVLEGETVGAVVSRRRSGGVVGCGYSVVVHCWAEGRRAGPWWGEFVGGGGGWVWGSGTG